MRQKYGGVFLVSLTLNKKTKMGRTGLDNIIFSATGKEKKLYICTIIIRDKRRIPMFVNI